MLSAMLLVLGQIGPHPGYGSLPDVPEELRNRQPRREVQADNLVEGQADQSMQAALQRAKQCNTVIEHDAAGAVVVSEAQARAETGAGRVAALQCKGIALSQLGRFADAAESFLLARDGATDPIWRGAIGAQRAFALAQLGRVEEARSGFDNAINDKMLGADRLGAAQIFADKAGVEIDAGDNAAARATLEKARLTIPESPHLWLLSATLARRENALEEAQSLIEHTANLGGHDPSVAARVGLEAGVIAALSGRYSAARQSFTSVIAYPDAGVLGQSAQRYLEQLDAMEAAPQ